MTTPWDTGAEHRNCHRTNFLSKAVITQQYALANVTLLHTFIMWSCICYFTSSVCVYVLRICNGIRIIGEYRSLLYIFFLYFLVLGVLIFIECVIWGVQAFQRLHFRVRLLVSAACVHVLHVVISGCSVTMCIGLTHKNPSLFHREIDSCKHHTSSRPYELRNSLWTN